MPGICSRRPRRLRCLPACFLGGLLHAADATELVLPVSFNAAWQPLVRVTVGGQELDLVFNTASGDTTIFMDQGSSELDHAAFNEQTAASRSPPTLKACRQPEPKNGTSKVSIECSPDRKVSCEDPPDWLDSFNDAVPARTTWMISGKRTTSVRAFEAVDKVSIMPHGENPDPFYLAKENEAAAVKVVRGRIDFDLLPDDTDGMSLGIFKGAGGLFGCASPATTCRKETPCDYLLKNFQNRALARYYSLNFVPPGQTNGLASTITFGGKDNSYADSLVESEEWHGDEGIPAFRMYHMQVCSGVDLVRPDSSHWKAVVDTSGPCLTLPEFIFDRLYEHVPMICNENKQEENNNGLSSSAANPDATRGSNTTGGPCRPDREVMKGGKLPSISFALEDDQEPNSSGSSPRRLSIPLESLVFRNSYDEEFLCITRQEMTEEEKKVKEKAEKDPIERKKWQRNDNFFHRGHISLGSMVVQSLYTVIDLEKHTVSFSERKDFTWSESDKAEVCTPPKECPGGQKHNAQMNTCEDPVCYLEFQVIDKVNHRCVWKASFVLMIATAVIGLALMDFLGQRMYKEAIQKASVWS